MNINEKDLKREKTEFLNSRLSKLERAKAYFNWSLTLKTKSCLGRSWLAVCITGLIPEIQYFLVKMLNCILPTHDRRHRASAKCLFPHICSKLYIKRLPGYQGKL